jgi:hypothetical protein
MIEDRVGPDGVADIVVAPSLIVRQSTAPAPAAS